MAVGTNLKFNTNSKRLMAIVQQLLGNKRFNAMNQKCRAVICSKAGAPATNTAADDPGRKGVICVNASANPKTVWICTAYTNSTTFTWTQIA